MTARPGVSVILPTFNRDAYLADAIRSILAQSEKPLDFIVVDDGSTDGTPEIAAQFGAEITYVRQTNAGKLTAIATGLDRAKGDLVWIMDDDDLVPPDALHKLAEPFAQNPALVLSYGRMTRFNDDDTDGSEEEVEYPDDPRPFLVQMMEDCFVTGHPCVMVRRAPLEAMRPFDRTVIASVDYYLHLGVGQQGPAAFVDSVVLRQRQHDGLRGPARSRYSEADRNEKWITHDAYLLKQMIEELPLEAYLAAPPWTGRTLDAEERRLALLQRAVIAGRKKLWPQATEDMRAALSLLPDTALGDEELCVLEGMLGSRYGISEVYEEPEILTGLHDACTGRPDRVEILTALSRPLLHQVKIARRELDPMLAAQAVKSWSRLMDFRATRFALQSALGRNLSRAATKVRLT
jgi:glycosyltransferase involved in cell wall biosynthesis